MRRSSTARQVDCEFRQRTSTILGQPGPNRHVRPAQANQLHDRPARQTTIAPRTYANFCSIAHTPFDFTLTFCEVMPLSEKEIKDAESEHIVRAPVRAKSSCPCSSCRTSITALQEHWRVFSESYNNVGWNKGTARFTETARST